MSLHLTPKDFGLAVPITDREAKVLVELLKHGAICQRFGYVLSPVDRPPAAVLQRMGLVFYAREAVGERNLKRTLTTWWLDPRGAGLARALQVGQLETAEALSRRARELDLARAATALARAAA